MQEKLKGESESQTNYLWEEYELTPHAAAELSTPPLIAAAILAHIGKSPPHWSFRRNYSTKAPPEQPLLPAKPLRPMVCVGSPPRHKI